MRCFITFTKTEKPNSKCRLRYGSEPLNSNGEERFLISANNYIDNIFSAFADFLAVSKKLSAERPIRNLERLVEEATTTLNARTKDLSEKLDGLEKSSNIQNAALTGLASEIEAKRKETNDIIANWQGQFSEAQDRRQSSFNDLLTALAKQISEWRESNQTSIVQNLDKFITDAKIGFSSQHEAFEKEIKSYLSEAKAKHAAILDLYELTAGDSVASAYLKSAQDEKDDANFWRWATIVFVFLTVFWAAFCYITVGDISVLIGILKDVPAEAAANAGDAVAKISSPNSSPDNIYHWLQILKSLSVTGVLLFGAGYSAKQSNMHRNSERQIRWFALEVKAIDPFISSLDQDDQKDLKLKLTDKLFGQQNTKSDTESAVADSHFLETIFKGIVDIIKAK